MSGKLTPETVKPVPVSVAALTVTDAVPVEDRVRDWVAGEFRCTLPKATVVALTLSVGVSAAVTVPNCKAKLSATLSALAVRVAVCAVLTGDTMAVNVALLAPAATVTVAGTDTALLLLARLTPNPLLGAAALSFTEQLSLPAAVIELLVQLSEDRFVVGAGAAGAASSCRAKVSVTVPALAVRVAVCAVLTGETVAVNVALLAPAATVSVAGTDTALLLLARLTPNPLLGAAALSATVQESVPAPVIDPLAQLNTPRFVVFVAPAEVPVPLSPIAIVPSVGESLVIVT